MLSLLSLPSLLFINLVASASADECGENPASINICGPKGAKGEKGDTGVAGQTGMLGSKGDKGNIGQQGPYGKKGVNGVNGGDGQKGQPGSSGVRGPPGPGGPKGVKGESVTAPSPQSVSFSVGRRARFTATASDQVIPMNHVFYNNNNYFDTSSNRFKAPFDGIYAFNFGAGNELKQMELRLYAGKPETARARTYAHSTTHWASASGFIILQLKAGETASMRLGYGHTIAGSTPPSAYFSGFLIQALT